MGYDIIICNEFTKNGAKLIFNKSICLYIHNNSMVSVKLSNVFELTNQVKVVMYNQGFTKLSRKCREID